MLNEFITEYLTKLLVPVTSTPSDGVYLLSMLISAVLAYIPIHLILKPLVGDNIARYAFVAILCALLVFVAGSVGVFVGGL